MPMVQSMFDQIQFNIVAAATIQKQYGQISAKIGQIHQISMTIFADISTSLSDEFPQMQTTILRVCNLYIYIEFCKLWLHTKHTLSFSSNRNAFSQYFEGEIQERFCVIKLMLFQCIQIYIIQLKIRYLFESVEILYGGQYEV